MVDFADYSLCILQRISLCIPLTESIDRQRNTIRQSSQSKVLQEHASFAFFLKDLQYFCLLLYVIVLPDGVQIQFWNQKAAGTREFNGAAPQL